MWAFPPRVERYLEPPRLQLWLRGTTKYFPKNWNACLENLGPSPHHWILPCHLLKPQNPLVQFLFARLWCLDLQIRWPRLQLWFQVLLKVTRFFKIHTGRTAQEWTRGKHRSTKVYTQIPNLTHARLQAREWRRLLQSLILVSPDGNHHDVGHRSAMSTSIPLERGLDLISQSYACDVSRVLLISAPS